MGSAKLFLHTKRYMSYTPMTDRFRELVRKVALELGPTPLLKIYNDLFNLKQLTKQISSFFKYL